MKAVLMSIKPKYCELVANGQKTVEIRKTRPKIDVPFKVYIYYTKKPVAVQFSGTGKHISEYDKTLFYTNQSGKVMGEFVCNRLTYIEAGYDTNGEKHLYNTAFIKNGMCMSDNELYEFLYKSKKNCGGWAWHISNLVIYDKPKDLREFWVYNEELHRRYDVDENGFCCYDATNEYGEALTDCGDDYADILNCYRCWEEWSGWCHRLTHPPQSWCYVEELK